MPCPLLALSGHEPRPLSCRLLGVKRTFLSSREMSAFDPKLTSPSPFKTPAGPVSLISPEPWGHDEAAGISQRSGGCIGNVAAYGASAAGEVADDRISGHGHAFSAEPMDRRICTAATRPRLDR